MAVKIDTAAIQALRERLLESGGAPSIVLTGPDAARQKGHPLQGDAEAMALFDATFEAMFIMLCADGETGDEEKEVLRGAMRELTAGVVRSEQIEKMAVETAERLQKDGIDTRLKAISEVLKKNTVGAEAAFVLAAVMAFADEDVADEENDMLNDFADHLGLSGERANELLDALEAVQQE
jgi:tellurite resistance protein